MAGEDRGRGCGGGGFGMLGGCHFINPPRCGFHYAAAGAEMSRGIREEASSCKARRSDEAGGKKGRRGREEAADCEPAAEGKMGPAEPPCGACGPLRRSWGT